MVFKFSSLSTALSVGFCMNQKGWGEKYYHQEGICRTRCIMLLRKFVAGFHCQTQQKRWYIMLIKCSPITVNKPTSSTPIILPIPLFKYCSLISKSNDCTLSICALTGDGLLLFRSYYVMLVTPHLVSLRITVLQPHMYSFLSPHITTTTTNPG